MSGKNNVAEEEDFLTEDPEIPSQKYVLISFCSPEKILANKDVFLFKEFISDYAVSWKTSKLEQWLAGQVQNINSRLETIAGSLDKKELKEDSEEVRKNLLHVEHLVEEFQEYTRKNQKEIKQVNIQTEYEDFIHKNGERLEDEFFKQNEFRTTIRGIKIRGVFGSDQEAQLRAKRLQKIDPNFNVFMGAVGKWMAWDPEPSRVPNQEYANEQLNSLMKKYQTNQDERDEYYAKRKREGWDKKQKAVENAEQQATETSSSNMVDDSSSSSSSSNMTTNSSSYDGLFGGPADLALQRKMERENNNP